MCHQECHLKWIYKDEQETTSQGIAGMQGQGPQFYLVIYVCMCRTVC